MSRIFSGCFVAIVVISVSSSAWAQSAIMVRQPGLCEYESTIGASLYSGSVYPIEADGDSVYGGSGLGISSSALIHVSEGLVTINEEISVAADSAAISL